MKILLLLTLSLHAGMQARAQEPWTVREAERRLRFAPHDPYLRYVALQLSRGTPSHEKIAHRLGTRQTRIDASRADLMGIFTGALAVEESLQLEAMRARRGGEVEEETARIPLATLSGPQIRSHPWKELLAGREPELSKLARWIPHDQYFVLFRSLGKLLDLMDQGDLWATHIFGQVYREAQDHRVGRRLRDQLALQTSALMRPFYDMVVQEVAVTGSDPYLREGSDVTVIFRTTQRRVFEARMEAMLAAAIEQHPGAERSTGEIEGTPYVLVASPDREVHAYASWPEPGIHVRSNSLPALRRVLRALRGEIPSLAQSDEYRYIRTLFPRGDSEEDGFVYLSDAFVRNLVGPRLRLVEYRRMLCNHNLQMIGHAVRLYRTQHGKAPRTIGDLSAGGCAPGRFGQGDLACPEGGRYGLDAGKGFCSRHGRMGALVPCGELELREVSATEARLYRGFVRNYSRYWSRYFDPIALRVRVDSRAYRLETLVLPLIENSIYQSLAATLGGEPVELDGLAALESVICSLGARLSDSMVAQGGGLLDMLDLKSSAENTAELRAGAQAFLESGIGRRIELHIHDSDPLFDLNFLGLMGELSRSMSGGFELDEELLVGFVVASLNAPVHVAIPVRDASIVDTFLDQLDRVLAARAREHDETGFLALEPDLYRIERQGKAPIHCQSIRFGPIKWRVFWARIGDGLYITTKRWLLEKIEDRLAAGALAKPSTPRAHALLRIRAEHWKQVRGDYSLGWEENNRLACLGNLTPLRGVARALHAEGALEGLSPQLAAERLRAGAWSSYGREFFCPDGGRYVFAPGGRSLQCSLHGSELLSRQRPAPAAQSSLGRLLAELRDVTAALAFEEEGLRAVLTIARR